jgi:hypothetical protein
VRYEDRSFPELEVVCQPPLKFNLQDSSLEDHLAVICVSYFDFKHLSYSINFGSGQNCFPNLQRKIVNRGGKL